jgi:phosphoglycerate dehydrogenase-like enzyme
MAEGFTVFYMNPGAGEEVLRIVREELPPGWRLLAPSGSDYSRELAQCDFLLIADQPVTAEHLAAAPRLRMIQHQGVGYEKVDPDACRVRRIPLALTPEGTTTGVAEHTLLLTLALYKHLVRAASGVREGRWMQWELRPVSWELAGKTLGLVGFGRIGREVARRALAFDVRVLYYDPVVEDAGGLDVRRVETLEALLPQADIVSLHVPVTPATRGLMNARTLSHMKPGSVLVNTARGALVDEAALALALTEGPLAGAALDVLCEEPPDPGNPLLQLENVLITPHIAAGTRDALAQKMRAAFANLVRFTRGEPLRNLVPELADLCGESVDPLSGSR